MDPPPTPMASAVPATGTSPPRAPTTAANTAATVLRYSVARHPASTSPSTIRARLCRVASLKRSTRHSASPSPGRSDAGWAVTVTLPLEDTSSKITCPSVRPQPPPCVPYHSGDRFQSPWYATPMPNKVAIRSNTFGASSMVSSVVSSEVLPADPRPISPMLLIRGDLCVRGAKDRRCPPCAGGRVGPRRKTKSIVLRAVCRCVRFEETYTRRIE